MRLTREKIVRISHQVIDLLVQSNEVEFIEDRDTIRQKTVQIIQDLLKEEEAVDAEVRLYDNLFTKEDPGQVEAGQDFTANLNPNSLEVLKGCKLEPSLASAAAGGRYQFERLGYFCADPDSTPGKPVFNRTVALKDTWAKIEKRGPGKAQPAKA
jgi:glutamyl/glutaminyl-tRNA synthetase